MPPKRHRLSHRPGTVGSPAPDHRAARSRGEPPRLCLACSRRGGCLRGAAKLERSDSAGGSSSPVAAAINFSHKGSKMQALHEKRPHQPDRSFPEKSMSPR